FPCDVLGIAVDGNRMGNKAAEHTEIGKKKADHVEFCNTFPDHAMAYAIRWEGLRDGNFIKAATALHTIEDSYAHAGNPAEIGHATGGHWPDRTFNPNRSIPKFYHMIGSAMYGIVALRETIGIRWTQDGRPVPNESVIDTSVKDTATAKGPLAALANKPNWQRSARELAEGYRNLKPVRETIERYVLTDPEYVQGVVEWYLNKMQDVS